MTIYRFETCVEQRVFIEVAADTEEDAKELLLTGVGVQVSEIELCDPRVISVKELESHGDDVK